MEKIMIKTNAFTRLLTCFIIVVLAFNFTVLALENKVEIDAGKSFFVFSEKSDRNKVAQILGMESNTLADYCEQNNIVYLAVNKDNSKQIRAGVTETAFSGSVGNLSDLSDSKIKAIMPDITGAKEIQGEIIDKNGQKFIKTHIASNDSGGKYSVVQYITVAAKKIYTLNIYSAADLDTDYTEEIFESFNSPDFNELSATKNSYNYIIIAAIAVFVIISGYIIYTIIRDIKLKETD